MVGEVTVERQAVTVGRQELWHFDGGMGTGLGWLLVIPGGQTGWWQTDPGRQQAGRAEKQSEPADFGASQV